MEVKKILLIGPHSGAPGGVKIHLNRLVKFLATDVKFDFVDEAKQKSPLFFNIRSRNLWIYGRKIYESDVIHIHSGRWWLIILHIISSKIFCKKVIVTIHSLKTRKSFVVGLIKLFLNQADNIILVNSTINNLLHLRHYFVRNAFIPPLDEGNELPPNIKNLISNNKIIVSSNAYRLIKFNNEDLYGLDLCIEIADICKQSNEKIFIIFVIGDIVNSDLTLYNYYNNMIKTRELEGYITIICEGISFISLIQASKIVIRPTNTDGDALTIHEALYYKKPVIASDVVPRPAQTILFQNRNANDLYHKMILTLKNYNNFIPNYTIDQQEIRNFYINVYSKKAKVSN